MMLTELARIAQVVSTASKLRQATEQAAAGDADARRYLAHEGIHDVANLLQPGAGVLTRRIQQAVIDYRGGGAVEGEWRELDAASPPWGAFKRHWSALPSGGNVLLGPIGQGKTTLANHLAARLRLRRGYGVEYVAIYDDDRTLDGADLRPEKLATRVARIILSLNPTADEEEDDDDAAVEREERTAWRKFLARVRERFGEERISDLRRIFGERVIVVDEAGSGSDESPHDPYHRAIVRSLDECRHVDWHVVMISQRTSGIPKGALSASTLWIKQPSGREYAFDRADNPYVRDLWQEATEAFALVRRHPYWGMFPDPRDWSFVDSPPRDHWRGWRGLVPFDPRTSPVAA